MENENVYLGVWTNHDKGTIMGATLTTTRQQGNLLIAFTGFLIPFVASRFWAIFCLILHRAYSTSESRDTIHHQRQVILRNSSSAESGFISLLRLLWAWRHSKRKTKQYSRILPVVIFAIFSISAFSAAGGFSSQISTSAGDKVLLKGDNCGIPFSESTSDIAAESYSSQRLNDAVNYAQQCYTTKGSGILACNKFVTKSLPTDVWDYHSNCPFQDHICQENGTSVRLDTGT
jgi:hypothetical protein